MGSTVPYGETEIPVCFPGGVAVTVARSATIGASADSDASAVAAIAEPIGARPLAELAVGKERVVVAVTDATRLCPDHVIVPPMLAELERAGVPVPAVTILVAVGAHRPSTHAEQVAKLGANVVERYNVINHNAFDPSNLVKVTDGPGGVPFTVNRLIAEADLVVSTGRIEPHQYGGYSGGGKTVAIGCAGEEIITYTHGPAMLDREGVRLGQLIGNPFQEAVRRVAEAANVAFVGNVILDDDGRLVEIAYGAPAAVQDHLAAKARSFYEVTIPHQFDIAVAGVGSPKDVNLYQASRAASYLQYAPTAVVRDGGVIILPATCPEGPGEGVGERQFGETMRNEVPAAIIARIRRDGVRPGEQRAYIMANVLKRVRVIVAGAIDPYSITGMGFDLAPDLPAAIEMAVDHVGIPASAIVVPHALLTLPIVRSDGFLLD
jgi:nickel-dependent lactate racemase